jgi:spore coat polysaccharide biosynthesis protein SpsF
VLATPETPENDALEEIALEREVSVFRGSEDDVLSRFCGVIEEFRCRHIVRVCGDNPFVDPEEVDRAVEHHCRSGADYTFNHVPDMDNQYPNGLGAEVFKAATLLEIKQVTTASDDLEHINNYVLRNRDKYKIETFKAPGRIACPEIRLDVDTESDLSYLRKLVAKGELTIDSTALRVIETAKRYKRDDSRHTTA